MGGQKTKWKTPSPNEELIESITNIFSGGSREKSYEVSKLEGGRGGLGQKKKKIITF